MSKEDSELMEKLKKIGKDKVEEREGNVEDLVKSVFLSVSDKYFVASDLRKLCGCSDVRMNNVLRKLESEKFVFRVRGGKKFYYKRKM